MKSVLNNSLYKKILLGLCTSFAMNHFMAINLADAKANNQFVFGQGCKDQTGYNMLAPKDANGEQKLLVCAFGKNNSKNLYYTDQTPSADIEDNTYQTDTNVYSVLAFKNDLPQELTIGAYPKTSAGPNIGWDNVYMATPYWPDKDKDGLGDSTAQPTFFCGGPTNDEWVDNNWDLNDNLAAEPVIQLSCVSVMDETSNPKNVAGDTLAKYKFSTAADIDAGGNRCNAKYYEEKGLVLTCRNEDGEGFWIKKDKLEAGEMVAPFGTMP